MKTALITGITGQGGGYLAKKLVVDGYRVVGTSRDARLADMSGLRYLGLTEREFDLLSLNLNDFTMVVDLIDELRPDEIYHLASPSSVARSFQEPTETTRNIVLGTANLLEAMRRVSTEIRFFNAASTEIFGECDEPADENTPIRPKSPYGVAKASAYWQTRNYREAYDLFACSGIFSNFESPLRPVNFVTRKIISAACRIACGETLELHLGNTQIRRDWGWAGDYVDGARRMLLQDVPKDYVLATGKDHSLTDFLDLAFQSVHLDFREHVQIDNSLFRPLDISRSVGNPSAANVDLGWRATLDLPDIVKAMVDSDLEQMEWNRQRRPKTKLGVVA